MYNPSLLTFITVAECGSFAKASEKLFISNVAVMNQINSLEEHLGAKLFERTSKGVLLTEQGKTVYKKSLQLIKESNEFVNTIKKQPEEKTIRIGLFFIDYISNFHYFLKSYQFYEGKKFNIEIILLDNSENFPKTIRESLFAKKVDMIYSPKAIKEIQNISFNKVRDTTICFSIPTNLEISAKETISYKDLTNHTIIINNSEGIIGFNEVSSQLKQLNSIKTIESIPFDGEIFFRYCVKNNLIILTNDKCKNLLPFLRTVPLIDNIKVPFGFYALKSEQLEVNEIILELNNYNEHSFVF